MTDGTAETGSESISEWLTSLARTGANPGGGAAGAVMAGMAAALAEMVAAYRTSAKSADVVDSAKATAAFAAAMRTSAPALADEDTAASSGFAAAYQVGPEEREAAKRAAGLRAAESSVELGKFVERLVPVLRQLAGEAGEFLLSDVGTASAALAGAPARPGSTSWRTSASQGTTPPGATICGTR
ncbi:cyclodeaminase/cyclohydrolase family protein [Naasia aerilata]|uniref:Cyclodeaminase/cyclohydrolase domain-containing protein n=1 Tax=Naasia aerilata TaxID=1162966 RepID=A0ABM8G8S7_9MICO|nr:cyclodeaminase/cyclohydrolase family protein [Naasia aerilata]BDZ44504.1 hypothetical protein GCM10025866_04130 [Naasia aerilata]